jgi:hypothetical protein
MKHRSIVHLSGNDGRGDALQTVKRSAISVRLCVQKGWWLIM